MAAKIRRGSGGGDDGGGGGVLARFSDSISRSSVVYKGKKAASDVATVAHRRKPSRKAAALNSKRHLNPSDSFRVLKKKERGE